MRICLDCRSPLEAEGWACRCCAHSPQEIGGFRAFAPEISDAGEAYDPSYFQHLAEAEDGHFWFEHRNRVILWGLAKYAADCASLLEIGCGTGFVLEGIRDRYPELHLTGSEIFVQGLGFAQARLPGVELFQMDARAIPFDREFDCVGAFDVLEHIEEDRSALAEMRRSLKPGGILLVTVPQHRFLWSDVDERSFHKRRYVADELTEKLQAARFQVEHMTSFVSLLLPAMYWSRMAARRKPDQPAAGVELNVGATLNRLLSRILTWEMAIVRRGWTLPAGGSLFAIARRPLE